MREFILQFLEADDRPRTISEIFQAFKKAGYLTVRHSVRGRLNELTKEGRILRVARATYASLGYSVQGDEGAEEHDSQPPEIPDQEEGLAFAVSPNGRIGFAPTGLVSDDDDIAQVTVLRVVLLQALEDLLAATTGSNAFITVHAVAQNYRAALEGDIRTISVDQLFAQGVRLENANVWLKDQIDKGYLPEKGLRVGESLDSVLALHGTTILSTRRGKRLLELSRQYNASREQESEYKARATAFAAAIAHSRGLVEPDVKQVISALNADIGEGRFPERSSDVARRANRNLTVVIAKLGWASFATIAGAGLLSSVPGTTLTDATAELINVAYAFLQAHVHELRQLAAVAGPDLSWLRPFLDWWERQTTR